MQWILINCSNVERDNSVVFVHIDRFKYTFTIKKKTKKKVVVLLVKKLYIYKQGFSYAFTNCEI